MIPDDADPLSDELVERLALLDEDLACGGNSGLIDPTPIAPALEDQWQRLEACVRLLHRRFPRDLDRPTCTWAGTTGDLGAPSGTFGRFRIRGELGRGGSAWCSWPTTPGCSAPWP
jgi:hypothetical protein